MVHGLNVLKSSTKFSDYLELHIYGFLNENIDTNSHMGRYSVTGSSEKCLMKHHGVQGRCFLMNVKKFSEQILHITPPNGCFPKKVGEDQFYPPAEVFSKM